MKKSYADQLEWKKRMLEKMNHVTELVNALPEFDYEIGPEGRKVTFLQPITLPIEER